MAMMDCTHDKLVLDDDTCFMDLLKAGIPLDLARLPALRHFKCRLAPNDPMIVPKLLNQLLSSSSDLETLEIDINYNDVDEGRGCGKYFLSAWWSRLDNLFTSEKFVSLRKVVLSFVLHMEEMEETDWDRELERRETLLHVSTLFPKFRALADTQQPDTQRTLEIYLQVNFPEY